MVALRVAKTWADGGSHPLPRNTGSSMARSLAAADLEVGAVQRLCCGWGVGSSWVAGHLVQPAWHVHSLVPWGTLGQPVADTAGVEWTWDPLSCFFM